jgi:hypothetical protein
VCPSKALRAAAEISAPGPHVVVRLPGANGGDANEKSGGTATRHPAVARSCSELVCMADGPDLALHCLAFLAGPLVGGGSLDYNAAGAELFGAAGANGCIEKVGEKPVVKLIRQGLTRGARKPARGGRS